jgi:hypothetical protein
MSIKIKCAYCKHRLSKKICGYSESPHHNQQIDLLDSCEFFEQNPAQLLYSEGLAAIAVGAEDEEVVEKLETAIQIGLPEEEEIFARYNLGKIFYMRGHKCSPRDINHPDFCRGIQEMEKAVLRDSQGGYGVFSDPVYKGQLSHLAGACLTVMDSIRKQKGFEPAIMYLKEKLHLFDYLSSPPLLLLYGLGELYADKGDIELAQQTLMTVLQTSVNPISELETRVREGAEHKLKSLNLQHAKKSGCFIATAVYGKDDVAEIELLKYFRDNFLMRSSIGKLFVSFYYLFSPGVATVLEKSELAKNVIKRLFLEPILWFIKRAVKEKNG